MAKKKGKYLSNFEIDEDDIETISKDENNNSIEPEKLSKDEIIISIDELKAHPKNAKLLPKLTSSQLKRLKDRIKQYGFNEAIEITRKRFVIDGNNRVFNILKPYRHELKIDLIRAKIIDIPEKDQAEYIISKNFDRRQLSKLMQSYIRGQQYNSMKKQIGSNQYSKDAKERNSPPKKTSVSLAEQFRLTERTIRNDGSFAKLCNKLISNTCYDFVFDLLNGEIKASKTHINKLSKQPKSIIKKVLEYYSNSDDEDPKPLKEVLEMFSKTKKADPPTTIRKRFEIEFDRSFEERLKHIARKRKKNENELVKEAIEKYITEID